MAEKQLPTLRKVPTLIEGLDQILKGGLPMGRTTLINGGPGSGKSLFGLEFLYRGALEGQPGIFISFEERAIDLRVNTATLGWDLPALENDGSLFVFEARIDPTAVVTGGRQGLVGRCALFMQEFKQIGHRSGSQLTLPFTPF